MTDTQDPLLERSLWMRPIRRIVGGSFHRFVAFMLRWGNRGSALLARMGPRRRPIPRPAASATIHVRRTSDLSRYSRLRNWLWMARGHQWRTRWAAFDWYVTAETGVRLVSAAGIVDRQGAVGGAPAHLALLGGVFTAPKHRKQGLASDVVRRSMEVMAQELQCDFGVLICTRELIPFYERLGWRHVPNHLEFVRFGEPGSHSGPVMVFECAGRSLPVGPIDVMGLPA